MSTPEHLLPERPINVYKAIIDELVDDVRPFGSARHVRNRGIFAAESKFRAFIATLTPEQQQLLADMLESERSDTIHDVLACFWGWIRCYEVGLSYKGQPLPIDLSEFGLHGDYIARCQGREWPAGTPADEAEAAAIEAADSEVKRQQAEKDAAVTDRRCPHCGAPCPSYRKTCKACGKQQ